MSSALDQFDALQNQMREFSANVDRRLAEKRANIISARQDHFSRINELKNQETALSAQIESLQSKESKTKHNLKQALEAIQSQRVKVDELTRKQNELTDEKNELQAQIDELSRTVEYSTAELSRSHDNLEKQLRKNYPELIKYEMYLGLKIEAVSFDLMKFVFTNLDPNNYDRRFWIDLAIDKETYSVGQSDPQLSTETTNSLETELNNHKEIVKFLKSARNSFKELV
ncbi:predicted protein [Scheffersomyces stipitis CBS 6054]|uniref:Kinetochore protein SPC25 n=1 Tax=Scheffersomyces stipitis (strain ATCC 58785 / CBS 6054 / NBRC 10063 / NRRL Y-11545) TaxID=322104 RepID=A3LY14_PICST|nr:predicted protein [Scheffersomyces stipitis CBS 6054]ABN67900.2 predicted protein [Scheffersomyces stipitis CBS 6054]KAG2732082.1 hypothetical protein G9P44_004499 [Scheffersomyces stipitis]